ncbi:MAG: hypothetical protein BGP15_04075 [Sphingobacterium sp. 40-24]|uniref:hypothetical protein n=1 Tax=Sphingobacterium sp. 40-24 TaxID=1895843 RepID=UPI0009627BAA|nr:hypothetical protein [Sphingobacterium sp. 40-24]OJZ06431.1 MAG: hypothetical protein BGP15_04075 [Sphingobacterium sp. 40-24]
MKIELKSIYHSAQLSDETEAFTANLYINGVHAGYAKNEGHGGNTDYYAKDEKGRELIRQAEEHCKNLPPIEYPADKYMDAFSVDMDLEHYIDQQLYKYIEKKEAAKFNAKLNKTMLKGIVYGVPDQSYGSITFNLPLVNVLAHPKGPQTVLQTIKDKILPKLNDGNKLLNTNIPESIIKAAGLKEEQYVKPTIQNIRYGTIPDVDDNNNKRGRSR